MSKQRETTKNTHRIRLTESEVNRAISLKVETDEVIDSIATFISRTMAQLAIAKDGKA